MSIRLLQSKIKYIVCIVVCISMFVSNCLISYALDCQDVEWWSNLNAEVFDDSLKALCVSEGVPTGLMSACGTDSLHYVANYNQKHQNDDGFVAKEPEKYFEYGLTCYRKGSYSGTSSYIDTCTKLTVQSDPSGYETVGCIDDYNGTGKGSCFMYVSRSPLEYEVIQWRGNTHSSYEYSNYNNRTSGTLDERTVTLSGLGTYTIYKLVSGGSANAYDAVKFYSLPNCKIFDSVKHATAYLYTGDTTGLIYSPLPATVYDNQIYLKDFKMIVHDSNSFDNYYIDFKYSIPDSLSDSQSILLNFSEVYQFDLTLMDINTNQSGQNEGVDSVDILNYPSGFRLYLNDISAIKQYINTSYDLLNDIGKRQVLGSELYIDFNKYGLSNSVARIDKSMLYLSCTVIADNKQGVRYDGTVDFLTGKNDMSSYTPSSSGDYTFNNDYIPGGHYYTEVGKDGAGNTTYNYYYYNIDNSKTEITAEDSHDNTYTDTTEDSGSSGTVTDGKGTTINNNNNPTFNNNITIEGDSIDNEVNNIISSDTTTKEDNDNFITKFLGFFNLLDNNSFLVVLGNVFGWLPETVFTVLVSAIGIIAGIAVIKFFRK